MDLHLPGGHVLRLHSPFEFFRGLPRSWRCQSCRRLWRWDQADEGSCPRCRGRLRREF